MLLAVAVLLVVVVVVVPGARADRIVGVPYPNVPSHHMQFAAIFAELDARGHDTTLLNSDDGRIRQFTGTVAFHNYSCPLTAEENDEFLERLGVVDVLQGGLLTYDFVERNCDNLLSDPSALALVEAAGTIVVDCTYFCGVILADMFPHLHRIDYCPIPFSDPLLSWPLGVPNALASIPQLGTKFTQRMSVWERAANRLVYAANEVVTLYFRHRMDALRGKHGVPGSMVEGWTKTGMFISQCSWATEYVRPVVPAVRMVGPILARPSKPLPERFAEFAAKDFVLASLGAQVILPPATASKLVAAFATLKLPVLWKLAGAAPPNLPPNVRVVDWFPQNDLLGTGRVRAFFSHCGMNSCGEAAYHGVPIVGFPMFGDQWHNLGNLEQRGMALRVDKDHFTADSLARALASVLSDPSFRTNAAKVARILRDTRKPPVQLAADHIEFALRHDGALFQRLPELDLPFFVRYGLDVLALAVLAAYLGYRLLRACCSCCCRSRTKAKRD